jgi:23S rRNA pseudouridine1911/1915/1917 synthase
MEYLRAEEKDNDIRLDIFLAERVPHLTRAKIQRLIGTRTVLLNGQVAKSSTRVHVGDEVQWEPPLPRRSEMAEPEEIPLDIVYEDEDILVVNKQRNLVVHPAPGAETGTLVNALLAHGSPLSTIGGRQRPGIVHRLDKDTTGLLVVAKNDAAHESLSKQIQARTAIRKYYALLWGQVPFKNAVIDAPIGRHQEDRKRMTVYEDVSQSETGHAGARDAVTEIRLLEHLLNFSWVEAILQTGRTHQIRVHCAYAGYPVAGDATYGGRRRVSAQHLRGAALQALNARLAALQGQALHAHALSFDHPRTKKRLQFHAPLPDEIADLLDFLRRLQENIQS